MVVTAAEYATVPDCRCGDAAVQLLHELVEKGLDQPRASNATTLAFTTSHTRLWVRQSFAAAFPWLRLPRQETPQW